MNLNRILSKLDASQNHWSNFWWTCFSYERNLKLIFSMYRLFIKINWVVYKYIRLWVSISRRIRSVEESSGKSATVKKIFNPYRSPNNITYKFTMMISKMGESYLQKMTLKRGIVQIFKIFEKRFCTIFLIPILTESFRIDIHFSWSIKIEFALVLISCSKLARVVTSFWSCSCSSWSRCFKWAKVACRFLTSWTNLKMSIEFQSLFLLLIFVSQGFAIQGHLL